MSARMSTLWLSVTCSGAMYSAVPIASPALVISPPAGSACNKARPMSRIFTTPSTRRFRCRPSPGAPRGGS